MAWSIAQVARMSKVTSRTLRHYHEIGLLPPAWIGGNGYRYYERKQLLRLQEILVLRQLGLSLETISQVVRRERDQVEALRVHHRSLLAERDRFQRLADTVAATIEELERGERAMSEVKVEHWFTGIDSETQARYEAEAEQRWGVDAVARSRETMKRVDKKDMMRQWAATMTRLVELIEAGVAADDSRVFDILDGHHRWLAEGHWTPDQESYTGLGNLYADDPRFRKNFDFTHPELAEYMRTAMAAYARQRLA